MRGRSGGGVREKGGQTLFSTLCMRVLKAKIGGILLKARNHAVFGFGEQGEKNPTLFRDKKGHFWAQSRL